MTTHPDDDARVPFARSLDQVERLVSTVGGDDLGRPTPCDDFDVRLLLAHLLAVVRKLAVLGRGGDPAAVPDPADDLAADPAQQLHRARGDLEAVWSRAEVIEATHALSWGTLTGREVLEAYTHELTVHAWDLHRALGSPVPLDDTLARSALRWFVEQEPASGRSGGGPFGPAVAVADDADVHTLLAAYSGRAV